MKKLLFTILFLSLASAVYAADYPVSVLIDFENGSDEDEITTTILNNGTHGLTGWNVTGTTNMTIDTAGQKSLADSVLVGETTYNDAGSTRGFRFGFDNLPHYYGDLPFTAASTTAATIGFFFKTSVSDYTGGPLSLGSTITATAGDGAAYFHGQTGPAVTMLTSGESAVIPISVDTWYWVSLLYQSGGTHRLYVFNTTDYTLIGASTQPGTGSAPGKILLGRSGAETNLTSGYVWNDNMIADYSASPKFPLIPWTPKNPTPTHNYDTETYNRSVTVTPSTINPFGSIYYCTDTAGTCTPETLYSAPVTINVDGTHLRTLSRQTGWTDSAVKDSTYTITGLPSYVQGDTGQGTGATRTATPANPVTAGNVIAVSVMWNNPSVALTGVTDNCNTGGTSNTYTLLDNPTVSLGNTPVAMAYAVVGATTASCTVTATYASSVSSDIAIQEISGVNQTTPLDNNQHKIGTGIAGGGTDSVTSGNITTTVDGDYIFGFWGATSFTATAGTGFTLRDSVEASGYNLYTEGMSQATAGAVAATFTPGSEAYILTGVMAFQPEEEPVVTSTPPPARMGGNARTGGNARIR